MFCPISKQRKKSMKELETKYRALIEQIPNAVIYKAAPDEKDTTLYVSPQIMKILGYVQEENNKDPDIWTKSFHPEDFKRVYAEIECCRETGEAFVSEHRMIKKDGQIMWFRDEAHIIKDEHGKPLFLLGIHIDITDLRLVEAALNEKDKELQIATKTVEEVNTALKVLLKRREEDKIELEGKVLLNVKQLVLPHLEKLRKSGLDERQKAFVDILESNLKNIVSSFAHKLSSVNVYLTPQEIEIANLIKDGRTNKEISELLGTSTKTVAFHRWNIRKKLGILNKKVNLKSYLLVNVENEYEF
jgi:PAS domain S-box-containing protein